MSLKTTLKNHLEWCASLSDELHGPGCYERFVLKYGQPFAQRVNLPKGMRRGALGACYTNAAARACTQQDKYAYVEGYAMACGIPMLHAWLIDRDGNVIDPTWSFRSAYHGVIIRHDYVFKRAGMSMIDDFEHRWPLLTQPKPERHILTLEQWFRPRKQLVSSNT